MNLIFARTDFQDADATATFAVIKDEQIIGRVSAYGPRSWGVSDAGFCAKAPSGRFTSREDAAVALVGVRATCQGLQQRESGLLRVEEDVLRTESYFLTEPAPGVREAKAAEIGISVTNYLQIIRHLRVSPAAERFDPVTVLRLRERLNASRVRTARLHRDSEPAVALRVAS